MSRRVVTHMYKQLVECAETTTMPLLTTVRDKKQVYNSKQRNLTSAEEFLAVMRRLEKNDGPIAHFSM
ncbi:unnamed protein product, partial [Didymodactylos carnosus]